VKRLTAAGYRELDEVDAWALTPGEKVFVIRGDASLAAFEIGSGAPSEAGFRLVGAHTDSPNLRIKPRGEAGSHGVRQIAVEPYGGVLLHTWLDRDLSVAGRVVVKTDAGLKTVLVRIDRPLCRVASLAIHLHRKVNEDGLVLNKQSHLAPHFALERAGDGTIVSVISEACGHAPELIYGHDLCLYDVVPPAQGGAHGEFIYAPRMDNLASCHAGLQALCGSSAPARSTRGIVLYDHEEVGSRSRQGADSPFLAGVLTRIVSSLEPGAEALPRSMANSFMISADMAHAVHPNWSDRHEPGHMPHLGAGPVIKSNANQRYATDGLSAARFQSWCHAADVVPQHFVTRSDLGCGSTIGPISAAQLGMQTVDVGNPMLSMHSIREMAGSADVQPMIDVMRAFFEERGD